MSRARKRRAGPDAKSRKRVALVAASVLLLFVAIALRAVHLQVVRAPWLRAKAEDQWLSRIELLPARGKILDRNLRELAVTVHGASVFADPSRLASNPSALERLARVLGLAPAEARARIAKGSPRFAWLKRVVTPEEVDAVLRESVPGVGVVEEPRRYYPKKALAGQVLGFVGMDGDGLEGLEFRFDPILKGRAGRARAERDARGALLIAHVPDSEGSAGRSLVLTLDEAVQHIAEEELARAVEKSAARGGTAVVLEPATGDILALAQVPALNPNAFSASRIEDRKIKSAVDVYEPGSTFKGLFLAILLDRGLVRTSDLVFCENGQWRVHRRTIHDHVPHAWLSVADVLKFSSNIGVAKLSEKVSRESLYEGLRRFGIGSLSGAGIPGESRGILAPPRDWSKMTPKTVAYGQGVSATALQVASAFAALANGGLRMRPQLVRAVLDAKNREVERFAPEPAGHAVSQATAATVTRLLEAVVHGEGGTGTRAAVPGYTVAGKTGTSWKPNLREGGYHRDRVVASFAGYVPSRSPRIAILVAVDEPTRGSRYGGMVAAPAFREMGRRILAYLQIPPEGEVVSGGPPAVASRREHGDRRITVGTMPDVRGLTMREVLRGLEDTEVPIDLTLLGSGLAATQDPAPGTRLDPGQTCRVLFRTVF